MVAIFLWSRLRLGNLEVETVRVGLTNWDKKCQFKNTGYPRCSDGLLVIDFRSNHIDTTNLGSFFFFRPGNK